MFHTHAHNNMEIDQDEIDYRLRMQQIVEEYNKKMAEGANKHLHSRRLHQQILSSFEGIDRWLFSISKDPQNARDRLKRHIRDLFKRADRDYLFGGIIPWCKKYIQVKSTNRLSDVQLSSDGHLDLRLFINNYLELRDRIKQLEELMYFADEIINEQNFDKI